LCRVTNATISSLNYRDALVSSNRYFYVVVAVDSDGTESIYSNEVPLKSPTTDFNLDS
jgi:hypothetical protein